VFPNETQCSKIASV